MNEYEISKLKKELQRKAELLKEEREDREFIEKQLIEAQAQRDKYKSQLLIAKQTIQNIDSIIAANVKEMKAKLQEENAEALQQLKKLKDRVIEQKRLNEKLLEENKTKETVISQLSLKIRQISRNYKDPSLLVNTKQITQQAILSHNRFYKLTEKHNKLCADMDNILAENKILRKLHGVPDNFGFDLEQIKIAEKQELQDYKSQCRKLQSQIEELEAERTQLRYRLRQYNTLYSNKGERYKDLTQQQLQLLDAYALNLKQGKIELPQIDKTQKQMEKQILKLRAQVQVLQAKQPIFMPGKGYGPGQPSKVGDKLNTDEMKRLQEQIKSILQPFVNNIKSINETNVNNLIQILQKLQQGGQGLPLVAGDQGVIGPGFRPPIPLPHAYNDWSIIKEGYSYKYSCKIPINMGDLQSDLGFDVIRAKYQIASLQLQNIESLKLLKEKNKIEEQIAKQLEDLKSKYKKCLKVQDQLFLNYFKEKQTTRETYRKLEIQHQNIKSQRDQLQARLDILTDAFNTLSKHTDVEKKLSLYATRLATSEPQVIRLQRKYKTLNDEMKVVKDSYSRLEGKSAQSQYALKQKLLVARKNQSLLTSYLNQILDENKQSVSSDVHNSMRIRTQTLNDKLANFVSKQAQLRIKISRLESIEREMNIKDDIIDSLREDNMDLALEMQIIKNRLYCVDPSYRRFREIFKDLVSFINTNNISLLTYFKKFDRDNSGTLSRDQMHNALNTLGFKLKRQETQILYSQFDLDGSNAVSYRQFNRKLKRGGALSRSKQQQALFRLFKAIKQCNLTVKDAFKVIDVDGSNSVTKSQFESALRKIGIQVHSSTIDYIFKLVDNDMNGTISCAELEQIFADVVKETIIQEKEIYNVQLDWKYAVIIKIEQMSSKFNTSLHETFKKLDTDHNASLTRTEMMQFFKMCNIDIPKKDLEDFFNMLDKTRDGKIQYNQFLRVLAEAKKQKTRIERIKFIQKRAQQIKKENQINQKQTETFKISEEAGLKVRLEALETKHGNLLKKNDKLCKNLVAKEQEIYDLNQQITESEKSIDKLNNQYFKEKEANIILRQKMKNYIGQEKSKELTGNINKFKIINTELKVQLDRYKGLFQGLSTKNRADQLRFGKIQAEKNKYYDLVKDFQSQTDLNAQLAKKTIELQHSKYNEEIINKKYDQIIDDMRKIADQNRIVKQEMNEKELDFVNTHIFMKEKYNLQQRAMDQLSAKVFPTFTVSKLDMFIVKLRQISGSKSQLQLQNQALREKNFALQLRNDYIENEKIHLEELQRKLRRNYTDQSSVTIIDLTKKLSEYKMSQLKSKRQCNLLKQKEDYYMRVNHTYADNVKELQEQIGKWEIKHNEREEFWKKKIADQVKLMQDLRNETQKAKEQQKKAVLFFKNKEVDAEKMDKQFQEMGERRREKLSTIIMQPGSSNAESLIEYQNQILDLRNELIEKQKQIYKYKTAIQQIVPEAQTKFTNFGSQIGGVSTNSFVLQTDLTTSQIKNNARRFIESQKQQQQFYKDQSEKMAFAAQQSIDTLQRIIDDKNDQLKRKEKIIEDLRKDFLKNKEQDCIQIQKLNEQIRQLRSKTQMASLNEMLNKPTSKNFYPKTSDKINDLLKAIDQKDVQIKEWQKKYDKLFLSKAKTSGVNVSGQSEKVIQNKYKKILKQRLDQEQQKQQQIQRSYNQRIDKLTQMLKMKEKRITQLSKTIMDLKDQCLKLSEQQSLQHALDKIQKMVTGNNVNEGKLEIMLQHALQQLANKNKKEKQMNQQLRNVARLSSTKKR